MTCPQKTDIFGGFFISYIFHKKTEAYTTELKRQYEIRSQDFTWKQKTTELLGQVYIHLNRTRLAFDNKYSKIKEYDRVFEDEVFYNSNKKVRDLLLENGHNIPPELLGEASRLIEHYDAWLIKYTNVRVVLKDEQTVQIFVGPDRVQFPEEAEEMFKSKYTELFNAIRRV